MRQLLLLVLMITSTTVLAQSSIYKTTDEHGNVVYTDAPAAITEGTEKIENPHVNSMPAPEITPEPPALYSDDDLVAQSWVVSITSPANETTIPHGPGDFSVSARVEPEMAGNQQLQLFMDGAPWGEPQSRAIWNLTNVFRGEHVLTVGIIDDEGESVAMSEPVNVTVHRPSIVP